MVRHGSPDNRFRHLPQKLRGSSATRDDSSDVNRKSSNFDKDLHAEYNEQHNYDEKAAYQERDAADHGRRPAALQG
jgi:hypothetical protein